MAESAIARISRPRRVRRSAGRTITVAPTTQTTLCQVMAWAGGYLMFDDPAAGADLYLRQAELHLDRDLPVARALALVLVLRHGAQSMPQQNRRGKALRRLLNAAADTIAAEVTI